MEGFLLYILKSAGISTLFFLCYVLFLKKETFFNANRVFLLVGLILSFIIPLISIKEVVWIEPTTLPSINDTSLLEPDSNGKWAFNWISVLSILYILGAALFLIRFLVNLLSLKRVIAQGDTQKEGSINFVETQKNTTPFSFFNYLIHNPECLSKSDFATIIAHERIHIKGLHSLDILLIHAVILVQWFNPFIWFYKDSVEHNLEFIADHGALKSGRDRIGYQNLMLKNTVGAAHPHFSNSFYNSIIKKRIVMLNKKKSQKNKLWKYGIALPLLIGFIFSFQTTTVAQVKVVDYASDVSQFEDVYSIKKNSTDAEIAEIKNSIEQKGGSFSHSLKRNTMGDIVSLEFKIVSHGTGQFTSTVPFSACYFGTLKGGGIFVADSGKDYENLKKRIASTTDRNPSSIKVDDENNRVAVRISSDNPPLIVIDGVEHPKADINNLDLQPDEIEKMNVLKDETAQITYGSKGKNGVIEITTKKKD